MSMKALVIEDDADVASILGRGLEAHGFSVLTAGDGERALELGETETFDLLNRSAGPHVLITASHGGQREWYEPTR